MARRSKRPVNPTETIVIIVVLFAIVIAVGAASLSPSLVLGLSIGLLVVALIIGCVVYYIFARKAHLLLEATKRLQIDDVDKMSGTDFEQYIGTLFENDGYKVTPTSITGDFGVDLVIEKAGVRTAVQCKRYDNKSVGEEAVQQAYSGVLHYGCQRSMVVTNTAYTKHARILAKSNKCILIGRNELLMMIAHFQSANKNTT